MNKMSTVIKFTFMNKIRAKSFTITTLVLALLVGAFILQRNETLKLYEWLSKAPDFFRPYWLPALLMLVYALMWAAAWLWAQLAPEQASIVYPDLDDAWATALESLQRAGIGIGDTPVFLVIGELLADSPAEDQGLLTFYLGEAHRRRGLGDDKAKAAGYYAQAVALPGAPPAAWREHGFARRTAGDPAGARASLQRYLRDAPEAEDRAFVQRELQKLGGVQ